MKHDKKILWIVSELFPPDETSTAYILGEIANVMSQKYYVKVICGPKVYDKKKTLDKNSNFVLDSSIEVLRVKGNSLDKNTFLGKIFSFILMSFRLVRLAKKGIKAGDKVLMVTNPAPLVLLMSMLKKKCDFELNILVHDVFPENTIPAGLKLPLFNIVKQMFDKAYSYAEQLIVLGLDMQDVVNKKIANFKRKNIITIIENWADTDAIVPQFFPSGNIILEYAGNIGRVQGLDKVIDALPENVEFHLYGTGSVEEKLKEKNHPNVFFHGPYFRSQQNEILSACHIALVTLEEGMYGLGVPSKTYNIMAAGRPILFLGPNNSEIDLLIKRENIGYCGWPNFWDKDELIEMGKRAREVAVSYYSKKIILDKFTNAI